MANRESTHDYQVIVDAPLEAVWQILAERFEKIDQWSSGVPGSHVADVAGVAGAPISGRVCKSSWRGFDDVTETIVEYGEDPHFFKYTASGTPAWMGVASNTWYAKPIDETKTLVYFEPAIEPAGWIGRLVVPMFIRFARSIATDTLDDLKIFVETGQPSERKRKKSAQKVRWAS